MIINLIRWYFPERNRSVGAVYLSSEALSHLNVNAPHDRTYLAGSLWIILLYSLVFESNYLINNFNMYSLLLRTK